MNKELKALNKIYNSKKVDRDTRLEFAYIFKEELEIIKQALTPPTADEICEELSEYLGAKVIYDKKENIFIFDDVNIINRIMIKSKNGITLFGLSSSIITMIGKFYERLGDSDE